MSVVFDCGELGFKSIAAHGHADALSFTLRAFGVDIFVDPGTYDYFTSPVWRDYFRSTRAHNTAVVDNEDQSVMLGPFQWGERARASCVAWEPLANGARVIGEHDGYRRLRDPALHRRTLELDSQMRILTIRDEILARGAHDVAICFHLAEDCVVSEAGRNSYNIAVSQGGLILHMDERLSLRRLRGSEDPIGGWISRSYHRKVSTTTLMGCASANGNATFTCHIKIGVDQVLRNK